MDSMRLARGTARERRRRRRHRRRADAASYWALHNLDVVAGIQITGSHNPPEYNGFKLGVGKASMHGDDIQRLYQLAVAGAVSGRRREASATEPVIDRYVDDVVKRIGKLSRPLRIAVRCGNGAGALVAPQLFARSAWM